MLPGCLSLVDELRVHVKTAQGTTTVPRSSNSGLMLLASV